MGEIVIKSGKRIEFIDISEKVRKNVAESDIDDGLCVVYCLHTTAAITINENADSSVVEDINNKLNLLIPANDSYSHSEGNSDAHIKASLIGASENIIIKDGKMQLGQWQGIFFCEFDGPRKRKVEVKVIKG